MRISFLLIFSFIVMTISTTVYALSSIIGEAILKHQIELFFEKELIEDYEIKNFKFNGLNLKFDVEVENKKVANIVGQVSLKDIMIKLNFQLKNINSKWIAKFRNIGYFSAQGEFKLTPWVGKVTVNLITEREKIQFIYRKKFITKKKYLKIINSNISTLTLHKLLNVDLMRGQIYLNGELIGNSEAMTGDMKVIINKIDLAPFVGASLEVMKRDASLMRDNAPFVFTNLKTQEGVDEVIKFIVTQGMLDIDK